MLQSLVAVNGYLSPNTWMKMEGSGAVNNEAVGWRRCVAGCLVPLYLFLNVIIKTKLIYDNTLKFLIIGEPYLGLAGSECKTLIS